MSSYSPEIGERICERIEACEPLAANCRDEDMPGVRTVLRLADEIEEFAEAYTELATAKASI